MSPRAVDHADLAAAGYFTAWSVDAGERADFHLSTRDPGALVSLVRLDRRADESVAWPISRLTPTLGTQTLDLGSSLILDVDAGSLAAGDWALRFELRLSASPHHRVLLAANGFSLDFGADGLLSLRSHEGVAVAQSPLPLQQWLTLDLLCRDRRCTVLVQRLSEDGAIASLEAAIPRTAPHVFVIGAALADGPSTLNAAIGRIALESGGSETATWHMPAVGRPAALAPSRGGGAVLHFRNAPTFAVRSARWDGTQHDPRQAPEHYDAVMLHDDDLGDAGWPVTHSAAVSADAESGVYGLRVHASGQSSTWPFFVTSRRRKAALVFLVPTFTYLAYANERLPEEIYPWRCDDAGHRFARANCLASLYDTHNDGTGVSLAGFRRPLATIRDDYRYPLCGAPHLLPVDLHLLRFLAREGIGVDLITDAELDRDGAARLAGYRGLVTGSHPEYWTGTMLDAMRLFQESGGHLAYLGGNGCYWVTACDGATIEVRRGERGIRTWSSESGESHLAMTGAPGGLWRDAGRAEHRMLGVGLAAMGFSRSRPYHRTPESYAADLTWLFDGVGDAPIGTAGIVGDGAAGYEIDCRSAKWGTPAKTILLAVAEGFDSGFESDPAAEVDGMSPVRGEMTLTRRSNGAMTFAAGSVAWCGALPHERRMNPVGLITRNLLRRFIA